MDQLLIADDDAIITRGLSRNIPWEEYGIRLAGTAADGAEVLRILSEREIHILISDIKMPFIDGIKLSEIIKSKYPAVEIILLSGYEDFEFAQNALKNKVFDYLLKPVENEVLLASVLRLKEEILKKKKIRAQIEESLPMLRQQFFIRLLGDLRGEELDEEALREERDFLNLTFPHPLFQLILFRSDEPGRGRHPWGDAVKKGLLQRICTELLEGAPFYLIDYRPDETAVLLNRPEDDDREALLHCCEEIRSRYREEAGATVTVGLGACCRGLGEIRFSYGQAFEATEQRVLSGRNRVYPIEDVAGERRELGPRVSEPAEEMKQLIRRGETEALSASCRRLEASLRDSGNSLEEFQLGMFQLAARLSLETAPLLPDDRELIRELGELFFSLTSCITLEELGARLEAYLHGMTGLLFSSGREGRPGLVERAMAFIREGYADPNLSLQTVADEVHINPTYLSILFGKEHSSNFSSFVLKTRMERAMALLSEGGLKTYEVADRVGYKNAQYFSVCFKKFCGMTPSEYRSLHSS